MALGVKKPDWTGLPNTNYLSLQGGGTSSKAPNTSSRYGWTTKTSSTLWQQNSSIEDKPGGCSTSCNSTSSFITDQGNPWASQMHCLEGPTMGLAVITTPTLSSSLQSSSQYALLKVWNSSGPRGMF